MSPVDDLDGAPVVGPAGRRPPTTAVDVAVIGAGQAGTAAAVVLGRAARTAVLIDGGPGRASPAGQAVSNDGGSTAYHRATQAQLAALPGVNLVEGRVATISGRDGAFHLGLEDGRGYQVRRIVLATGVVDDLPDIEGLRPLWGRTVVHCPYCHGWELRGRPTAVLAQEPVGVLLALKVAHLTDDVAVCLDGAHGLSDHHLALLHTAYVEVWPQPIARLEADGDQLRRIVFADGTSRERSALYVLPAVRQAAPFAADLGCRLLDDGTIQVDELGHTSVPGVHAVGDIAQRPRLPLPGQQAAVAAAEGVTTAIAIDQELLLADHPSRRG